MTVRDMITTLSMMSEEDKDLHLFFNDDGYMCSPYDVVVKPKRFGDGTIKLVAMLRGTQIETLEELEELDERNFYPYTERQDNGELYFGI